jgi:hypothetical protein
MITYKLSVNRSFGVEPRENKGLLQMIFISSSIYYKKKKRLAEVKLNLSKFTSIQCQHNGH